MSADLRLMSTTPPIIEVVASDKLELADYEEFGSSVESLIEEHGKVRILLRLVGFEGWTAGALWEDIKFDVKHFNDIERLAIVGDKTWEKGMAKFCEPFTTASINFYTPDELDQAERWLRAAKARQHAEQPS